MESFNLDFRQSVSAVTVNEQPARFHTDSVHELVITLSTAIAEGDAFDVSVTYSGSSVVGSGEGYEASGPLRDGGVLFLGEP